MPARCESFNVGLYTRLYWRINPPMGVKTRVFRRTHMGHVPRLRRGFECHVLHSLVGQYIGEGELLIPHSSNSGNFIPWSTCTANISCTPDSKRRNPIVSPISMWTTHTPRVRALSLSTSGMPLNTALLLPEITVTVAQSSVAHQATPGPLSDCSQYEDGLGGAVSQALSRLRQDGQHRQPTRE